MGVGMGKGRLHFEPLISITSTTFYHQFPHKINHFLGQAQGEVLEGGQLSSVYPGKPLSAGRRSIIEFGSLLIATPTLLLLIDQNGAEITWRSCPIAATVDEQMLGF